MAPSRKDLRSADPSPISASPASASGLSQFLGSGHTAPYLGHLLFIRVGLALSSFSPHPLVASRVFLFPRLLYTIFLEAKFYFSLNSRLLPKTKKTNLTFVSPG